MNGFIKIHRQIMGWGWYQDTNTFRVFIHVLLNANFNESEYKGVKLHPGDAVIGRKKLAEDLGLSEQNVRTALDHLKSTNEITIRVTNRFSIVHVEKWELYQSDDSQPTNKVTNKPTNNQPATNQQLTTPEESKNNNIYKGVPPELREAFKEFAHMRTKLKKPITTERTVTMLLKSLNSLASTTEEKIAIINQSVDKCWQGFYALKEPYEQINKPQQKYDV